MLVERGYRQIPDTACVWAYRRPSQVDHHEWEPYSVFGRDFAGEEPTSAGQLTSLELSELSDWAGKDAMMLRLIRAGRRVDMEQFTRRLNRLRGAIIDAMGRASAGEIRELLRAKGLSSHDIPEDIATRLADSQSPRW